MRNPYIWLITDTHYNADFKGFRPGDYARIINKNCRRLIAPQDILIHLGDVIDDRPGELGDYLKVIPGRTKILVRGNHDKNSDTWYLNKGFNLVCDQIVFGDVLLSHIPQPLPKGIRLNIHGHFHDNPLDKCFFHEPNLQEFYGSGHKLLAMEQVNYEPVRLDEFAKLL